MTPPYADPTPDACHSLWRTGSTVPSFLAALIATAFLVVGCANDVNIFSDEETIYYTIQADWEVGQDTLFVRVEPARDGISVGTDSTIDATVTLQNLSTDETVTLTDSLMRPDGILVHNFWTTADLAYDTRYRLTVERSDGATTTAEARTPDRAQNVQVFQTNEQCLTFISVFLPEGPRVLRASAGYTVDGRTRWVNKINSVSRQSSTVITIQPECDLLPIVGTVDTTEGAKLRIYRCTRLDTGRIGVAFNYLGPDWPLIENQSDQTTQATRAVNVQRGLGFFGLAGRDTVDVFVDPQAEVDSFTTGGQSLSKGSC